MMNDVRRHIARTMAVALVLLAWSCNNEGSTTAEQVDAGSAGEPRAVKIAVTETDWDGHIVSVTRSGETLEALKDNSDREWDFTKTPLMDISVLKADVAKAEGNSWVKVDDTYESNSAFSVLQANGVTLYMTEDLTFSGVTATQGDLRIDVDKRLMINKNGIGITLPSLKKGQEITVEFSTTSDTKSRNIVPSGSVSSTDAVVSTSTSTHAECVVTMTADGSPTFTVGSGTEGSSVYIYKISVTRAESDGFGLYSSSDRMKVINSHIVWDADIQSWKGISNDAYLMLWPNNTIVDQDAIAFTAYSPYISDGNLATGVDDYGIVSRDKDNLVFKPHSDNRIDLMYAEHTTDMVNGVVQLNFKHALGKLSVGTIYNDYGENLSLDQITISGTRRTQGTLSLSTGEWSDITSSSENVVYNAATLAAIFGSLTIPDKGSLTFPKDVAYTQIPGTTLTFTYQFKTAHNTTFTVSATMEVEMGKNKFVNITINQNHQVVLE